jgi:hypothetical protein
MLPLAALWRATGEGGMKGGVDLERRKRNACVLYRGDSPVVVLRAGSGEGAIYAGMKGGYAASDHGHMDVGSFIVEMAGVRWAVDLGREDYGYVETHGVTGLWEMGQESQRWSVFRIGPEGHNIARYAGMQQVGEKAKFVEFAGEGANPGCVLDLSGTYRGAVGDAKRGMRLLEGKAVMIQDEWAEAEEGLRWQMLTEAEVTVKGRELELRQAGKVMMMKVMEGVEVTIEVEPCEKLVKKHDSGEKGVKRIVIRCRRRDGGMRVLMGMENGGED